MELGGGGVGSDTSSGTSDHPSGSDGPAADDREEIVVTPGGPRPRRLVTGVSPGQAVHFTEQGGFVVTASDQSNQNPPDEFVLTPGGYRHKSLVHSVGAGVAVNVATDVIRLMNVETADVIEELPSSPTVPGTVPAGAAAR